MQVVAPADGALTEVFQAEDASIESEQLLANFKEGAGAAAAPSPATDAPASAATEEGESSASPAARKLADEQGIDIKAIAL